MSEQAHFTFDADDLYRIHCAVTRWRQSKGLDLNDEKTLAAAREAFRLYRRGMGEDDLVALLRAAFPTRH